MRQIAWRVFVLKILFLLRKTVWLHYNAGVVNVGLFRITSFQKTYIRIEQKRHFFNGQIVEQTDKM
jgi:hypothetical protein